MCPQEVGMNQEEIVRIRKWHVQHRYVSEMWNTSLNSERWKTRKRYFPALSFTFRENDTTLQVSGSLHFLIHHRKRRILWSNVSFLNPTTVVGKLLKRIADDAVHGISIARLPSSQPISIDTSITSLTKPYAHYIRCNLVQKQNCCNGHWIAAVNLRRKRRTCVYQR